jgi:hypothetical protein
MCGTGLVWEEQKAACNDSSHSKDAFQKSGDGQGMLCSVCLRPESRPWWGHWCVRNFLCVGKWAKIAWWVYTSYLADIHECGRSWVCPTMQVATITICFSSLSRVYKPSPRIILPLYTPPLLRCLFKMVCT